jgi:hypothetical protein
MTDFGLRNEQSSSKYSNECNKIILAPIEIEEQFDIRVYRVSKCCDVGKTLYNS